MTPLIAFLVIGVCFYLMSKIVDEYFLSALDNIADWLKMPPSVAGATLLAVGTSAPELGTSMFALFLPDTNPALGIGTVVGSAIFQLLIVVGITAMLAKSSKLHARAVMRDGLVYLLAATMLFLIVQDMVITFTETVILFVSYLGYLGLMFFTRNLIGEPQKQNIVDALEVEIEQLQEHTPKTRWKAALELILLPVSWPLSFIPNVEKEKKYTFPVFAFCVLAIAVLSYVIVISAEEFALALGIPSSIIALTILAGGTSLPELVSSAILAREGKGDMAIANAIGSNSFDIMISLGFPVLIFSLLTGQSAYIDDANVSTSVLLLIIVTIAVLVLLTFEKYKITKRLGVALIVMYSLYAILVVAQLI